MARAIAPTYVEAAPGLRRGWVHLGLRRHLREVVEHSSAERDETTPVAVDGKWEERIREASAVPIEVERRVEEGVRHGVAQRRVRIGNLEAVFEQTRRQVLARLAVAGVVEAGVGRLVPGVGAAAVLPGLDVEALVGEYRERRYQVLAEVLVLIVAPD
jgi:hypothetical protein